MWLALTVQTACSSRSSMRMMRKMSALCTGIALDMECHVESEIGFLSYTVELICRLVFASDNHGMDAPLLMV